MREYINNLLIAFDQLLNAFAGGMPDETLSSRWGRTRSTRRVAALACGLLDKFEPKHCELSIEFDERGRPRALHLVRGSEATPTASGTGSQP